MHDQDKKPFMDWIRPTDVFITFLDEDFSNLAQEMKRSENDKKTFLKSKFKPAPEPTDIIWENRHWTYSQIKTRESIAYGSVVVMLLLSFYLIYYLTL